MPAIRDGRGKLTEYDMGTPPGTPSGPVERAVAPTVIPRTPGIELQRLPKPAKKSTPLIHHDAGSLRARAQVDEGRHAMSESEKQTDERLTTKEKEAIDALREHGTRKAAAAALGLGKAIVIEARLANARSKGLLPPGLPDLPLRLQGEPSVLRKHPVQVDRAGLTDGEHRRAVKAAGGPEAGGGPGPSLAEMAAAIDAALTPDFTPRPVEGEDRCDFVRLIASTLVVVCDREPHDGGHRGRLVRVGLNDAGVLGHAAVPA